MAMLIYILLAVVVLALLLVAVAATRPVTFTVQRSLHMAAPPAAVFAQVADLRSWAAWSPWEKRDPALQRTYGAIPAGVGATYAWRGNKQVGEGSMTISAARPDEHLGFDLVFLKPFAARHRATFDFAGSAGGTTVSWAMHGTNNLMCRVMGLVISMDRLIGKDFEQGLRQLKAVVEAGRS
jgi:hypothetical protein